MTTPGGVPNLPQGALTLATLASDLQDMTGPAMRSRAVQRFPSIFNTSTGLNPALDITPFGILTGIWAQVNSLIANADPADIQGPEDIPALLLQFIEGLPVVGQLVGLLEAILGTYAGDDPVLLEVQTIFAPIRAIVDALTAVSGGTGGLGNFFPDLLGLFGNPTGLGTGTVGLPGIGSIPLLGGLFSGGTLLGSLIPGLDASKIVSGTFGVGLLQPLIDAISTGFGGSSGLGFTGLSSLLGGLPVAGAVIDALLNGLGIAGSGFSPADLLGAFTDLGGILGNPTGLGTGTVGLPGIGSIPILGGLLSGGSILGSLIPGLDASKIITGAFPISMITNLSTLLTGFGTSSSILSQLIGIVPNATGGLSGLTGLGSVFTDLFGLVGSPTAVGSGTPVLPGIGSIPVLSGLLSGGSILGSLIPGLDASKIITGIFGTGQIPSLPASQITSGTFGTGLIPSLDASKITTGTLGTSLIPTLGTTQVPLLQTTLDAIFHGHGGSGTASTTDVQAVIADYQTRITALEGGGTLTQYTTSQTWTNPTPAAHNLITVIVINGGMGGSRGAAAGASTTPPPGGLSGGYVQKQLYTDAITSTVAITVSTGTAGSTTATTHGATPSNSSFGSYVVGAIGLGSVQKADGSYATSVPPGRGGNGGALATASPYWNYPPGDGEGGPFAAGGRGGLGAVAGGTGSAAPAGIPSGGGGGGGGGVISTSASTGGAGGAGGSPGGGGGGGGVIGVGGGIGNGGTGATGCVYVIT